MPIDQAVHSDFLIHWTGKDIDGRHDPHWSKTDKSKTNEACTEDYIQRLRDTLELGLWMTIEPGQSYGKVSLPDIAKCCFTELKLSQSRAHARQYGRLGLGFKRPFLFQRLGRPLVYFGFGEESDDPLLHACAEDLSDQKLLHFFKPMNSTPVLDYDLYGESEWRILPFKSLVEKRLIIDARDPANQEHHSFFKELPSEAQSKLGFFVPLDGWFAMIIYPSLAVKNQAQGDKDIRDRIEAIKTNRSDHGNRVEGGNWPIELDLDACRNF